MKKLFAAVLVLPVMAAIGVAAAGGSPPDGIKAAKAATARYHSFAAGARGRLHRRR
jgi:hypothetical protein